MLGLGDLAGRLAVVPMSQEARGLDAGPRLADKLVGCGDNRTAAIVSRIALEEKAHVAVGVTPTLLTSGSLNGGLKQQHIGHHQQCVLSACAATAACVSNLALRERAVCRLLQAYHDILAANLKWDPSCSCMLTTQ